MSDHVNMLLAPCRCIINKSGRRTEQGGNVGPNWFTELVGSPTSTYCYCTVRPYLGTVPDFTHWGIYTPHRASPMRSDHAWPSFTPCFPNEQQCILVVVIGSARTRFCCHFRTNGPSNQLLVQVQTMRESSYTNKASNQLVHIHTIKNTNTPDRFQFHPTQP